MPREIEQSERLDPRVWKIVSVAILGSFLSQLDATVVNVSLSGLAAELHTGLTTIQWVTSGYLLALALMLPLNGWLVERIGAKKLYLICFTGFTASSALCALSWSAGALIGFRVLQGISGGLMAPMAQLMMARAAGKQMVRVLSYATIPILIGPVLGPVIAGAILQHASWRWLFLVNVPIGTLAVVLAVAFLPKDEAAAGRQKEFDLIGFLLLSPALVLFLFGSDHLSERMGIGALALALVLMGAFFRKARRAGSKALIDLELFRGKAFAAAARTQFTVNGLAFAGQMLIPVYLIRAVGKSPATTGWLMAPMGLGMMCTYPSLGRLTRRFGIRGTSTRGAAVALLGTLPFVYMSFCGFNVWMLAIALLVRGMGMSAVGIPSISAAYSAVRKEELPMATTSLNIVQRLGGPTLTTLCATFLGWRMAALPTRAGLVNAFAMSFALLCGIHLLLMVAATRLPKRLEPAEER